MPAAVSPIPRPLPPGERPSTTPVPIVGGGEDHAPAPRAGAGVRAGGGRRESPMRRPADAPPPWTVPAVIWTFLHPF